jgi:hypothetical protein
MQMGTTAKKADATGVSAVEEQKSDDQSLATGAAASAAVEKLEPDSEISGPLNLVLSKELRDAMSLELREALEQIEQGFGDLTKPGDVFNLGQQFDVINAVTIDDYLDKTTGELKVKHVFQLQFSDGVVRNIMQSTARPRKALAEAFRLARGLGGRLRMGPYKMSRKAIPNQIQAAYIFEQQAGFGIRNN